MTTIEHGRRSGQKRVVPQKEFLIGESSPIDIRNVTVLSKEDWSRITTELNKKDIQAENRRKAKESHEGLKKRSREMIKDWDNTLLGARQKKLDERARRLAVEEEERKKQDLYEAELAAESRKKILEDAKIKQYYQTDRVKNFHSALRFTEVLKEREAQIELKKIMASANTGHDEKYLAMWQKEYEEAVRKDQEEASLHMKKRRDCTVYQAEQIRQKQLQLDAEKELENVEGEELRRLGVAHALERKRLEQIHKEEQHHTMKDNLKQIADVQRMKEVQKLLDEEEDEECRIFAAAKKKMMRLRAEKEREIHTEKMRNLERIKERLAAELKAKKDDEEDRLYNAVHEREQKLADDEQSKAEKHQQMLDSIKEHREQQRLRREKQAQEMQVQERELMRARKEADELFRRKEAEKIGKRLEEERKLAEYHKKQGDEVKEQEARRRMDELEYEAANLRLLAQEEDQFQTYATKVIEHCERGGRNTIPLKRAARSGAGGGLGPQFPGKGGVRPSYQTGDRKGLQLPHWQRNSTDHVKTTQQGPSSNTNKRLGMVW